MNVFVFGSNESGIHGAGAAFFAARNHGAIMHVGFGPQGASFAIPTKDWHVSTLPKSAVEHYVQRFIAYARAARDTTFHVTQIGCGLAGFRADEIAPMFASAPLNCEFSTAWAEWIPAHHSWTSQ